MRGDGQVLTGPPRQCGQRGRHNNQV